MDELLGSACAGDGETGEGLRTEELRTEGKGARLGFLELDGLTKQYRGQRAVDGLSLTLERGEMLALLGPSGSGKTTTLRLLAGFEAPDAGRVVLDGRDVTPLAPVARRFGMVFQHYALFPHLDVGANVAFGLESRGVRGEELARRVAEALTLVDLAGFERRPVCELSGGQQQRVALARALAPEPSVLLLDEPLSNLDPALRERTRRELRALVHRLGITTIVVTHEQEDAFDLGDRIALLRQGRLEQLGTADELYAAPATAFVAGFIGRASDIPARVRVQQHRGGGWLRLAGPLGGGRPRPRGRRGPVAGAARGAPARGAVARPAHGNGDRSALHRRGGLLLGRHRLRGHHRGRRASVGGARGRDGGHRAHGLGAAPVSGGAVTRARRASWWGWLLAAPCLARGLSARPGPRRGTPRSRGVDARRRAAFASRPSEWHALWASLWLSLGERGAGRA